MTSPDQIVLGAVEETKLNAENLDLTWGLRMAKVNDVTDSSIQVILDGDTSPIPALSLIGTVTKNGRYWVLRIPPSGNYIVGIPYLSGRISSGLGASGVSTLSTSYVTTAISLGTAFVAPASGEVTCLIRASIAPAAGASAWMSVRVGTGTTVGSGTVIQAASDSYALMLAVTGSADMGTSFELTGLTPGLSYNVELQHRTSTGTSFWSRREVIILP